LDWCRDNLTSAERAYIRKKRAQFGKPPIEVHVFLIDGSPFKRFDSLLALSRELSIGWQCVQYCLKRKTTYKGQYYFSKEGVFDPATPAKRGNVYYGWNNKQVFLFNLNGENVEKCESAAAAAIRLGVEKHTVYQAISRQAVVNGAYYVSRSANFDLPQPKKYNRNPLLRPTGTLNAQPNT
jgi:hypothetical protein